MVNTRKLGEAAKVRIIGTIQSRGKGKHSKKAAFASNVKWLRHWWKEKKLAYIK